MTVYILGAATLILLVLILWRFSSPEFRRRSEQPKFQILANLDSRPGTEKDKTTQDNPQAPSKGTNEHHEP
ncbi:MAG: hypothetical protein ACYCSN_06485 [Acidobacteriaceae bacterium]